MAKTNGKDWAFPLANVELRVCNEGLTKMEYFTAMAMQGLLSLNADPIITTADPQWVAKSAVAIAYALIQALNEQY